MKYIGAIISVITAPFWIIAGFGCILCIATAGLILWCYDKIRRKK